MSLQDFYMGDTREVLPASDIAALCRALSLPPAELAAWLDVDASHIYACRECRCWYADLTETDFCSAACEDAFGAREYLHRYRQQLRYANSWIHRRKLRQRRRYLFLQATETPEVRAQRLAVKAAQAARRQAVRREAKIGVRRPSWIRRVRATPF